MAAEFDKEFDDKQCFLWLIYDGGLEKIPTSSVKKTYSKRGVFEAVSDNKVSHIIVTSGLQPLLQRG